MPSTAYLTFCVVLGVVLCFGLWTITFGRDRLVYFGFEFNEYQPTGFLYFLYVGAIFPGCYSLFFSPTIGFELELYLWMYTAYAMAVIIYQPMDYIWQNFEKDHLEEEPGVSWVIAGFCFWGATLFALPGTMMDDDDPYFRPFGFIFYAILGSVFMIYVLKKIRGPDKTEML